MLWSLSIEEVSYLGFPLVCLLVRRRAVLVPLLVRLALSLPWSLASMPATRCGRRRLICRIRPPPHQRSARPPVARDARALRWCGGAAMLAMMTLAAPWLWRALHDGVMLMLTLATLCLLSA